MVSFLTIGLRPFYLLGGAFAAVALPIWHFVPGELLPGEPYLAGAAWHAHEMVFRVRRGGADGFFADGGAGVERPRHAHGLAARGAGGALGRGTGAGGDGAGGPRPSWWIACSCPALRLPWHSPSLKARNYRNLPVAAVPALLGAANLLFHLDHAGLIALARANGGALLALDLFALLVTLMAGRVIPAFTANAVPAARPRRNAYVEIVAFGTLGVLLVAGPLDPWLPGGPWLAGVAALGALAHSRQALALGPGRDTPRAAALGAAALLRLAAGGADLTRALAGRRRRAGGRSLPCLGRGRDGRADAPG